MRTGEIKEIKKMGYYETRGGQKKDEMEELGGGEDEREIEKKEEEEADKKRWRTIKRVKGARGVKEKVTRKRGREIR